jgi:hypothetical protein
MAFHTSIASSLFSILLFIPCVLGGPIEQAQAQTACNEIKRALPGKLSLPNEPAYNKENFDYYNIGLAELKPACIAFPESAEDVSKVVKILNTHRDVKFAIKSGGHDPNAGHSSVSGGVLIALRRITGTTYDREKKVAYVKPGGHWTDPVKILGRDNVTVVSGRLGRYLTLVVLIFELII